MKAWNKNVLQIQQSFPAIPLNVCIYIFPVPGCFVKTGKIFFMFMFL